MSAWNGWYHCMASTYGTWLPGDPRGFRTRHHRRHVEGDYKSPPPEGAHDAECEQARRRMKRDPVVLSAAARRHALDAILHALAAVHHVDVLAVSVGGTHLHVLARFGEKPTFSKRGLREKCTSATDDPPRHYIGIAKKESSKALSRAGLAKGGGIWARRGKVVPVHNRRHQVNVFRYILDHEHEGAAVWSFRQRRQ